MGRIGLQLRATLENITGLRAAGEDFRWYLKLKCGNCGEVSEKWQYLRLMDSAPLKGGRGSATMVQKCKLCSRENSIDILSQTIKPYNAEDSEKFKTIVEFECRGLEPVDFQPQPLVLRRSAEGRRVTAGPSSLRQRLRVSALTPKLQGLLLKVQNLAHLSMT
ncbi:CXXC motif containing zinc binding protein isoform X1 [Rissa tridactyla]|uniref:CXXC motif containing zinc binding protein isoform X1 n=2 Tax=Rissa tridactyla TaxID=75485 RepID=UPI0023BB0C4B|nr:CXXC motif containing zinc binding protein isoform X1 [Rissa tridactyla]